MIHKDLKPQNILTTSSGQLKLTDFGAAKELYSKQAGKNYLTPAYASPQQNKNQEHTDKCDVYALGCMFF